MNRSLTTEEIWAGRRKMDEVLQSGAYVMHPCVKDLAKFVAALLDEREGLLEWGYDNQDRANQLVQRCWDMERRGYQSDHDAVLRALVDATKAQLDQALAEVAQLRAFHKAVERAVMESR